MSLRFVSASQRFIGEVWAGMLPGEYDTAIYEVPEGADPAVVDVNACVMLDICGEYDSHSGAVKDLLNNLEYYDEATPVCV